ncbi:MAG: MASE1 domain-containing protein [Planctomycetes bacterium]|nr:MASE1 domain-containing protein [Planctomycetota bacterium]
MKAAEGHRPDESEATRGSRVLAPARHAWSRRVAEVVFVLALFAAAQLRETPDGELRQAIVWLPSGLGIAGLWTLGWRAWWCIALAAILVRLPIGYPAVVTVTSALGSVAEAAVGVVLLRRFRVSPEFARLRDVVTLCAVAAVAPLASIAFSWVARTLSDVQREVPFYSGWDGWWRMNALGVLVAVPVVTAWHSARVRDWTRRTVFEALATLTVLLLVLGVVLFAKEPTDIARAQLYSTLPVSLFAAVRFGARGAATTGAIAGLLIAVGALHDIGPFNSVGVDDRHTAIQVFMLSLVTVPLVFGALIGERERELELRVGAESTRRALQRLLPDTAYRLRGDGTIVEVYARAEDGDESTRRALVGASVEAIGTPELAVRMRRDIRATLASGSVDPHDYVMRVAGRERIREARYVRLSDDEVLCLLRDITLRKRTEQMLAWEAEVLELVATGRESHRVLRRLIEGIEQQLEGGVGAVLALHGDRLHHVLSLSLPETYSAAIDGFSIGPEAGSCGTAVHTGHTVVTSDIEHDSRWKPFAASALSHELRACWSVPIRSGSGRAIGTVCVYFREPRQAKEPELAVLERAASLAAIVLEREQHEHLLASIDRDVNEGVFRSTADRGLIYVNSAMVRLFGFESREQLLRAPPESLHADPTRRAALLRLIEERGSVTNQEVTLRRRDGSTFIALVSGVVALEHDGRTRYFDGAVTDITANKELEDRLRQAQKLEAVGQLAGGVAHDFNNLLTAITGCAESLCERLPPKSRESQEAHEVLRAADRGAALTRQLLAYGRQQVLAPSVHDMNVVVDDLATMLRRVIGEDIALSIEHAAEPALVRVDRGQIEQVLLNLVLNARDALPHGGAVRVVVTPVEIDAEFVANHPDARPGRFICFSIEDNGVGMDAHTRARAFDPFFTTKAPGKGTGLGLSSVYGIVRQSDGWADLASEPGAGTKVRVYLPHVDQAALPQAESVGERDAGDVVRPEVRPARILVAEDEDVVREIVVASLQLAGHTVLAAEGGEQALRVARATDEPIDLLLSDMVMPGMGGRQLAERLRADRPGLRVVFMSGYSADREPAENGAPIEHLQKPFTRATLLAKVHASLAAAR